MLQENGVNMRTGLGTMLERMIRASLLDKEIYREVAGDRALQTEAWKVTALVVISASVGLILASLTRASLGSLTPMLSTSVVALIAFLARVWVVQIAASSWLKRPTRFDPLFRALAYAQAPFILQIVPVVGQIIGLWTLVTTAAAIRDVTGSDSTSAAILSVIGLVGAMVATSFAAQILAPLFRMF